MHQPLIYNICLLYFPQCAICFLILRMVFFLTHKKVLFLSNRIHQSFPLLFCLERLANLSMFKKAQITQVYKASFQTYLFKKKIFEIFVHANHNVSWSYLPPTSSPKSSLS